MATQNKEEFINDFLVKDIVSDLDKLAEKKKENFSTYRLFKPVNKHDEVKIFPLSTKDNKNIAEIMEDFPKTKELEEVNEETSNEKFEFIISSFRDKVQEIQKNVNFAISDKVFLDNGKYLDINNVNLLDYQFLILSIFTNMNKNIKFKMPLSSEENPKTLDVNIPLDKDILNYLRQNLSLKKETSINKDGEEHLLKFDYVVRKLNYNKSESLISGKAVIPEDFEEWQKIITYKLSDNISVVLRPVNIRDYLSIYLKVIELQTRIKANRVSKVSSFLVDMNMELIKELIVGIVYNGSFVDVVNNEASRDMLKTKILNIIYESDEETMLSLVDVIYESVFRLEIDVTLMKGKDVIHTSTWFDTGLSFFFNF